VVRKGGRTKKGKNRAGARRIMERVKIGLLHLGRSNGRGDAAKGTEVGGGPGRFLHVQSAVV